MKRRILFLFGGVGLAILLATPGAEAGNRWMMQRMADDLNRLNRDAVGRQSLPSHGKVWLEAAVRPSPSGETEVRVERMEIHATPARRPDLPVETASTPGYVPTVREGELLRHVVFVQTASRR